MKFTWLNKQGVRSETGFELQRVDRFTMSYREVNRIITIGIDNGIVGQRPAVIMGPKSLEMWDSGVPIDAEKQREILRNIENALGFQDVGLSVE